MSVIYTGRTAPLDGKRKLSAKEAQQRAKAMSCIRSPHKTECQGQVYVGLFFDGTGNNEKWIQDGETQTQRARNKHSNVARLWDAHLEEPANGFFRYYMQGVGTPYKEIGDTTSTLTDIGGSGFAFMGADRINWGITSLFNAVHVYLTNRLLFTKDEQKALVNLMSAEMLRGIPIISTEGASRWAMLTGLEERLAGVVKNHQRKVKQINVSIFGFSRGAAQARACAHWLHQIFESENGAFELAGVPIRIGFMGIFDTVAAVGVGDVTPVTFGHMAWADGTQSVHPAVEDCAHFVALHEQRASFPLESATGRGNVGYPGMHSDVGGGYWPGEQGKSMPAWDASPHLSQIPLMDMHFAALKGGVPMSTIEEIKADSKLAKSFSTDKKLLAAYNNWLSSNGIKPAGISAFTEAHTKQYLRWRGTLHAGGTAHLASKRFYKEALAKDKTDLAEADEDLGILLRAWRERKDANATFLGRVREGAKDALHVVMPVTRAFTDSGKDPLSAHEDKFLTLIAEGAAPPAASVTLFEDYVHDSRAGFRIGGYHEPEWLTGGYARFRHVFLQSNSNSPVYGWANESLKAVKAAADATVTFFQRLYDDAVDTYAAARARIIKTAQQVRTKAVKTAHQVHDKTVQTADEVGRAAKAARNNVIRDANEAARIYQEAERKIILKYVKAQAELETQLTNRWNRIK
jgi:hypothetical protein